jgi:hypothetical protein
VGAGSARTEGISIRTLATASGLSPSRVHQIVADAGRLLRLRRGLARGNLVDPGGSLILSS